MSIKLRDLIRMVRACKTAAEERAVISKECALIRTAVRDEAEQYRSRNIAKLMYIHMLGYPTHFGQMECLKLISAPMFSDKRVGYLALTLLLTESTEVLTLVTNSLKVDLTSTNQYIQALSLVAIGNLATQDMARDLTSDVEKILKGMSSYLKKKAALATIRLIKKEPDLIEHLVERIVSLLKDRTHGVLISGIQLIIEVLILEPGYKTEFAGLVPGLVRLLRNFVSMGYSPEHDVSGVTDPFMQVKIIQLLGILGKGNDEASDQMNDVLNQVATNTETNKNAGNAILYECVKTILEIKSDSALRALAVNILGRFLTNRDNNIRYVALNTLSRVIDEDPAAVQRHRVTILECLKDIDVSIRQRALDLSFQLVNMENVKMVTNELLSYLVVAGSEQKPVLVSKIMQIVERFAPSKKWRVDCLIKMLTLGGNFCDESVPRIALIFIAQADGLQGYAVHRLCRCMEKDSSQNGLNIVAIWCMGEYAELLTVPCSPIQDAGEPPSEAYPAYAGLDIVAILTKTLYIHNSDITTKSAILNALMKVAQRCDSVAGLRQKVQEAMEPLSKSLSAELQQRASEYLQLLGPQWDALRPELLARMPVLDEQTMRARRAEWQSQDFLTSPTEHSGTASASASASDVLGLLSSGVASSSTGGGAPSGGLLDLDDMFGVSAPAPSPSPGVGGVTDMLSALSLPATPIQQQQQPTGGVMDLLSMGGGGGSVAMPPQPPVGVTDLMGMGMGSPSPSPSPVSPSPVVAASPIPIVSSMTTVNAFDKDGLKIVMELTKPDPASTAVTHVLCKFTNSSAAAMSNLVFQAAVPKYLKLEMHPPSSTNITAGGSVTQLVKLTNQMQGEKNIMMKLKIAYSVGGVAVTEMSQTNNFPALY